MKQNQRPKAVIITNVAPAIGNLLLTIALLTSSALWPPVAKAQANNGLSIVNAIVQSAEDSPPVNRSYRFMPGDFLHLTFQISGFKTAVAGIPEDNVRKLNLVYSFALRDDKNVLLAPVQQDKVAEEIGPEDKHWVPKRRVFAQLPALVSPGVYHARLDIKDLIGGVEASQDVPFTIGGPGLASQKQLTIGGVHFLRSETDTQPLDVAAYSSGDTVFARFLISGFSVGEGNRYQISYRAEISGPDGKPYLRDPLEALLDNSSFYPAPYVPGELTIETNKNSRNGTYKLRITVLDKVSGVRAELRTTFTLE